MALKRQGAASKRTLIGYTRLLKIDKRSQGNSEGGQAHGQGNKQTAANLGIYADPKPELLRHRGL